MTRLIPTTGTASVRLSEISRRGVLGGTAAIPLIGVSTSVCTDHAASACESWLARQTEHERLGHRWQDIEDRLFKQHNWSRLTRSQRNRFPEKQEMDALYDRMDALHDENFALLSSLPATVATTHWGICGKLRVAALEVCPEDHPEAHELIESILRDYRALHGV